MPLNEADTCRTYVLPKLYSADWEDTQIGEQKSFTDGRIVLVGNRAIRRPQEACGLPAPISQGLPYFVVRSLLQTLSVSFREMRRG